MVYQQFGLGGQDQGGIPPDPMEGGPQSANMPTVPGGQSESGVPPQRPGPGTLPPTSKPFGQRQAGAMPAIPGEGRGGGWDTPPLKPMGPETQPIKPAPGTWKLPARTADAGQQGGIQDDQGSA
jgi:hypothetical protein